METKDKLDLIAEYESQRDSLSEKKAEAIQKILTPEIYQTLAEIDIEFDAQLQAVNENIAALQKEIKDEVLFSGFTVKGTHYMAVWNKPRVTWDGKKLDGMMAIIPGLKDARKEGEPSVTIRRV